MAQEGGKVTIGTGVLATCLLYDYCEALDAGDASRVPELFMPGASLDTASGDHLVGSEIEEYFHRLFEVERERGARTKHFVTNARVEDKGEGNSTIRASLLFLRFTPGALTIGWGSYDVALTTLEEGLRLARMTIQLGAPFLVVPCEELRM